MYCKKCGTRLLNGVAVCHACGANVHEAELAKVYNPATGTNLNDQLNNNDIGTIKKEYSRFQEKSYGPVIILIVLIIIAIIVVAKFLGR